MLQGFFAFFRLTSKLSISSVFCVTQHHNILVKNSHMFFSRYFPEIFWDFMWQKFLKIFSLFFCIFIFYSYICYNKIQQHYGQQHNKHQKTHFIKLIAWFLLCMLIHIRTNGHTHRDWDAVNYWHLCMHARICNALFFYDIYWHIRWRCIKNCKVLQHLIRLL